ncbi:DUF2786 domain-containing protein [Nocardia farcinica]|uniref:DUF2786 domain-containing protein n=1 Tax=Nocardia farcinica TaxID=37329 RepID=UPI002456AF1E|nr:DUF2786 domain-containing protein [Nocardia farcinica]
MSAPNQVPERMLTRIGGLLRKAEATDNEHEAEAFLAAAQRLATRSSIDLAVARAHMAGRERRVAPVQRIIPIGEQGRKGLRTYVALFVAIAHANNVRCDVARTSTQVYAYGFAADIDLCEALYSSLLVQMVRAGDHYIKSGAYREATVDKIVTERRGGAVLRRRVRVPAAAVTARLNFQLAFAERIGRRLAEVKSTVEAEAVAEEAGSGAGVSGAGVSGAAEAGVGTGTAVALRNKEIELADFNTRTSEARGTWRGPAATTGHSAAARKAGDRAGLVARLGPNPELGGARGALAPGPGGRE